MQLREYCSAHVFRQIALVGSHTANPLAKSGTAFVLLLIISASSLGHLLQLNHYIAVLHPDFADASTLPEHSGIRWEDLTLHNRVH